MILESLDLDEGTIATECENCNKIVKVDIHIGDICPHCDNWVDTPFGD